MTASPRPVSLVAERAVRYLRERGVPVDSVDLAHELLATRIADEATARRVLEAAFAGDPRLRYREGAWRRAPGAVPEGSEPQTPEPDDAFEHDCVLLALEGARPARGRPFELSQVTAIRLRGGDVVAACSGETCPGREADPLREAVRETLDGAVPAVHDPPGSLGALERWLDDPLDPPISLRRLAHIRLGLPATHELGALLGRLKLRWRESDDPSEIAETLDACLKALRHPGETLLDLRAAAGADAQPIDWSRFAFSKRFLREIPHVPGTYRFYDGNGVLLYVGKSKNLRQRIGSYFRRGSGRSARVQRLLDALHRIEYEAAGSDLEAVLREAQQIRREDPAHNTQRAIHPRTRRDSRLSSILILEPAAPPLVLRAYLLRDGRLLEKVGIGPRGGGLKRIERLLEDHYFCMPTGPTPAVGPDVDVEMIARWLSANRARVVAFDPTDLPGAREVTDRLRWFLGQGTPFDPDGTPIRTR